MKVLVINCGSSSLKYQLIDMEQEAVLAKGICERIGIEGAVLTHKAGDRDKYVMEKPMSDHKEAVQVVLHALTDGEIGVIGDIHEITAVGHRVVHGGKHYSDSVVINEDVEKLIEECFDLAPLHNPANLIGIRACKEVIGHAPQVAVFDTAFHQSMPARAYLYGIPNEYYKKYSIRRYGFHGTSHSYVSKRFAEYNGMDLKNSKIVVCHLGNGASISAVLNGECVDTSMGLTPLEGLIMGTRCGDIDPAIVEFLAKKEGLAMEEVFNILNKRSGVLGMSGISSDFRDIQKANDAGDEKAQNTMQTFAYRVAKYIGSYAVAMGGLDGVAFTAGVGENNPYVRQLVCEHLAFMGIEIDVEMNLGIYGQEVRISTENSKIKVCVTPTDEELAIARETIALIE